MVHLCCGARGKIEQDGRQRERDPGPVTLQLHSQRSPLVTGRERPGQLRIDLVVVGGVGIPRSRVVGSRVPLLRLLLCEGLLVALPQAGLFADVVAIRTARLGTITRLCV